VTAHLSAPAIGYRSFKWDGGGPLKSTGVEASWPITREPQQARCITTTVPQHNAPKENCTCGIYAYSKPESVAAGVCGVVMGYGHLIVHPDGWRAESVELVALVAHDGLTGAQRECEHVWETRSATLICTRCRATMQSVETMPGLDLLARQYGVRLLDRWEDAAAVAREHGAEPVPEILHAEAEGWLLGPERHEPIFPDGMSAHYGDIERRVREMLPWLKRDMIRRVEMKSHPSPSYYVSLSAAQAAMPIGVDIEVRLSAIHPGLRAEVEITLHT
jgi:hypothetical protein